MKGFIKVLFQNKKMYKTPFDNIRDFRL